jgi:argininosuccinate synthase
LLSPGRVAKKMAENYELDSVENAQNSINHLLISFAQKVNGNLTVKLFNGDVTQNANLGMDSPFYLAA